MTIRKSFSDGFGWNQVDPFDEHDNHLWMKIEHLGHYLFAADFLKQYKPKAVADISCGKGYGMLELSRIAQNIVGVDSSPDMIDIASARAKKATNVFNAVFFNKDLDTDKLMPDIEEHSLDAITSFETLEHLVDPYRLILQFSSVLCPGGFFICSVPNLLSEPKSNACLPKNRYHKQLFSFESLSRMVQGNGLKIIYRLGQSWSYTLLKREQQLISARLIDRRLSDFSELHSYNMIRLLSYMLAYPTVEDVDGSYSIIIVAQKGDQI